MDAELEWIQSQIADFGTRLVARPNPTVSAARCFGHLGRTLSLPPG